MTKAQAIVEQFRAEWKARCPASPLLSSESSVPFERAMKAAENIAREETRTYVFADGSTLKLITDLNGQHSAVGSMVWHG